MHIITLCGTGGHMAGAIGVRAQPNRADGTYTYKEGSNSMIYIITTLTLTLILKGAVHIV